jgi:hypothetical protein
MSKRFGRNQRRRLKEQLAVAEDKASRFEKGYYREAGLLTYVSSRNAELRATIEEIERMASRFSILVPPSTVTNAPHPFRVISPNRLSDEELMVTTLNAVESAIEMDQNGRVHALLQHPDGKVHYALSSEAACFMTKEELITMITRYAIPDMVRSLVDQMKGKK